MSNYNQFIASQNLLYNFFKWISIVDFSLRSYALEAHLQEFLIYIVNTKKSIDLQ